MKTQSLMLLWCLTSTALMAAPPTVDIASVQSLSDQPVLVASAMIAEDTKSTTRTIDEASLMAAFDNHPDLVYATPMAVDATDFKSLQHYGSYLIELADGNIIEVIAERKKTVMDRMLFVSGPIAGFEDEQIARATVAFTDEGMIADLQLPDGQYQIRSVAGMNWLFDPEALANMDNMGTLIGDQPALHLGHDPEIGHQHGNASTKSTFTTLNVALVLSKTHGTNASGISSALYRLELANDELERTGVNLRYNPTLVTRVKPSRDNQLNNRSDITAQNFSASGTSWLDLNFSGLQTSPSNLSSVHINQYVLLIGPGSDTLCGATVTAPNQTGRYSVVRANGCTDPWTMAHELGHNLSCVHEDGAIKPFNLFGDPALPAVWKSVMTTGYSAQAVPRQFKIFFTAGNDSPTSMLCGGFCNTFPAAAHDCAGKMEAVAPGMANQFDVINLPAASIPPDAFEVDDTASLASDYLGVAQNHNFHDNGDSDWIRYYSTPAQISIRTTNLGPNADTCMRLYRSNSTATGTSGGIIASNCDGGPGQSSVINFTQNDEWVYYIRVYSQNSNVSGQGTNYTFSLTATPLSSTPDAWEVDDTASQASSYLGSPQAHDFHDAGDVDWILYYAPAGFRTITATAIGSNSDPCIRLYRSNSTATGTSGGIIASNCDGGPGQSARIVFNQPDDFVYFVRVHHQTNGFGANTQYSLSVQ